MQPTVLPAHAPNTKPIPSSSTPKNASSPSSPHKSTTQPPNLQNLSKGANRYISIENHLVPLPIDLRISIRCLSSEQYKDVLERRIRMSATSAAANKSSRHHKNGHLPNVSREDSSTAATTGTSSNTCPTAAASISSPDEEDLSPSTASVLQEIFSPCITFSLRTNSDLMRYRLGLPDMRSIRRNFQILACLIMDNAQEQHVEQQPLNSQMDSAHCASGHESNDSQSATLTAAYTSIYNLLSMLLNYFHDNRADDFKNLTVNESLLLLKWLLLPQNRNNEKLFHLRSQLLYESLDVSWRIELEHIGEAISIVLDAYYDEEDSGNGLSEQKMSEKTSDREIYWFLERLLRKIWANRRSTSLLGHLKDQLKGNHQHWSYIMKRIDERDQWHHYDVLMRYEPTYESDMKQVLYNGTSHNITLVLGVKNKKSETPHQEEEEDTEGASASPSETCNSFETSQQQKTKDHTISSNNEDNSNTRTFDPSLTVPDSFPSSEYIKLPVHKELLSAKCPYFSALFGSSFKEARMKEIPMLEFLPPPHVESYEDEEEVLQLHNTLRIKVLRKYIEYLYTNHITFTRKDLVLCILLAEQLSMGSEISSVFFKQSMSALRMSLTPSNVGSLVELFDSEGLRAFQATCIKFGIENWKKVCDYRGIDALPEALLEAKKDAEGRSGSKKAAFTPYDPRLVMDMA